MKKSNSRRNLIKSIAGSSGAIIAFKSLPETWTKPAIESVILPAHAETTDNTGSAPGGAPTPPPCCDIAGNYCGTIGEDKAIKITIDESGAITILANLDKGEKTFTASVPCTGGTFTAVTEHDDHEHAAADIQPADEEEHEHNPGGKGPTITGMVICNSDEIIGHFISGGGHEQDYTANKAGCDSR